jgi:putative membrane protein
MAKPTPSLLLALLAAALSPALAENTRSAPPPGTAGTPPGQSGSPAQGGNPNDTHNAPGFGTGAPRGSTGVYGKHDENASPQALDRSDREFLETIAAEAQIETALLQLASQRAQDERVRRFADGVAQDHLAMTAQVQALVRSKSVPVENDLKSDRVYRSVANEDVKHFDKKFLEAMIDWHQRDLKRFETIARRGKDGELRKFAETQTAALKRHLDEAEQLKKALRK